MIPSFEAEKCLVNNVEKIAAQMDDLTKHIVHADFPSLSSQPDIVVMVSQKSCAND